MTLVIPRGALEGSTVAKQGGRVQGQGAVFAGRIRGAVTSAGSTKPHFTSSTSVWFYPYKPLHRHCGNFEIDEDSKGPTNVRS